MDLIEWLEQRTCESDGAPMSEDDITKLTESLAICSTECAILRSEKAMLKKRVRELEHVRQLDQAEIINLRRQIQMLVEVRG